MSEITELERRLIAELRADGRAPIAALAERLGVSRTTISRSIERLTARDVIIGFTVRTRSASDAVSPSASPRRETAPHREGEGPSSFDLRRRGCSRCPFRGSAATSAAPSSGDAQE